MQFGQTASFTEVPAPPLRPLPEVDSGEWRANPPLEIVAKLWWAMTWRTLLIGAALAAGFSLPAFAAFQLAGLPPVLVHGLAVGVAIVAFGITGIMMLRWLLSGHFYNFRVALMTDPMD